MGGYGLVFDRGAIEAKLRASLEIAAEQEAERVRARLVCPPHRAVTVALDVLLTAYDRLEHWSSDRCLERYRRMRH